VTFEVLVVDSVYVPNEELVHCGWRGHGSRAILCPNTIANILELHQRPSQINW
jgi:hypothetical protein